MTTSIRRLSAVIVTLLTLGTTVPAFGQDAMTAQENLELFVGDIFEITPSHDLPDATYTWILTQDRTFIEAGRAQTFRKRLITPGRYTLYAEISGGGQNLSRTFVLDYKARVPGQQAVTATGSIGTLVRTSPISDEQGRVVLSDGSQLLKLDPVNPDLRPIAVDFNLDRDTDGDGDPANDIDTDLTFFQTDATPLYIWFAQPISSRPMAVTVAQPEGALQQRLEIYSAAYAAEQGITRTPSNVTIEETGNRTFSFSAGFPANTPQDTPLLYHWEFGDGQQSLLANPVHEYASDGTFEVKLRIRDLTDGSDIATYTEQLEVAGSQPADPVVEEPAQEEPVVEPAGSGRIGSILMLAGIFIVSILFGIGIIFVLVKLRGRGKSFSDTIEKMEQTIVKKDDSSGNPPTLTIAPPPETPKAAPPPEIAQREKDRATPNPAQQRTPTVEAKNAPAWLKSGLTGQPVPATPAPAPQTAQQTPPAPKPAPVAPPAPAVQPRPQTTPPWIQPTTPPAAVTPQAPVTPKPAPVQSPAPASVAPPAPRPAPTPAPAAPQPTPVTPPAAQQSPTPPVTPPQQPKPVTPPAPQPNVPAWLQTPAAAPQTAQPAAPAAPATPPPTPATPVTTPTPVMPPRSVPIQNPPPAPARPVMPPASIQPPVVPPAAPAAPVMPPATTPPAPQNQPASPAPTDSNDKPVAFIRAENLQPEKKDDTAA